MENPLLYRKDFRILAEHVTVSRELRSSVLLRFIQEASIAHTEALGTGRAKTLDRGLLWVILGEHVEVSRLPVYDEPVTLLSWPGPMEHILFPRYYELRNRDTEETLVRAAARWILIDQTSRKMIFPERYDISIPGLTTGSEVELPPPVAFPDLPEQTTCTATYSLSDINGHLNNTAYLDLTEDLIPLPWLRTMALTCVDISYKEEIPLGESFDLHYGQTGNAWYFRGGESPEKFRLRLSYRDR
ncbi:MAG: hypothetical protein IJ133_07355 [Clostridia bacterium]|nr:hypothetical protein [Clostridia bacterium]